MADNNEKIIAALIEHGTITAAAKAAGVTPRNIYDKMNDRIFLSQYNAAKNEILRAAQTILNTAIKFTDRLNDADNNSLEKAKQAQEFDMFGL